MRIYECKNCGEKMNKVFESKCDIYRCDRCGNVSSEESMVGKTAESIKPEIVECKHFNVKVSMKK